jgi:hypothetical protein
VPEDLLLAIAGAIAPVWLHGSPTQLDWAASIRDRLVGTARMEKRPLELLVLKSIGDASWFIANKQRGLTEIRWPVPDQLSHRERS